MPKFILIKFFVIAVRKSNRILVLTLAFLTFALLPLEGYGQKSDLGNWIIYFGNYKINSRWNFHSEAQYRNYDALGDLEQLLLRTGVGYNLSENNNNILLGYGFIETQNYIAGLEDKVRVDEHRLFQQFIKRHRVESVFLQHRFRLEERFIESDFKMRFRYFLAVNVPLNSSEMENNTFYLSTYNEIFLNANGAAFDRNRAFGGLGFRLNPVFRFELGYMNQFLNSRSRDQINIITFVSL